LIFVMTIEAMLDVRRATFLSFKVGVDDPRRFTRSRTVGAPFGDAKATSVWNPHRL
jgi:hypothetical protein